MMEIDLLLEPELEFFGGGRHVDIRTGLRWNKPFDFGSATAPKNIKLAIIGTTRSVEGVSLWLERCRLGIAAKASNQYNLFPDFPGFDQEESLPSFWVTDSSLQRIISQNDIDEIGKELDLNTRIVRAVDLFFAELQYLAQKSAPGIVICAIPECLLSLLEITDEEERNLAEAESSEEESKFDFRDLLKAKAMQARQPTQLILPDTYGAKKNQQKAGKGKDKEQIQDEATRAWNFYTALYYKSIGTPWRLVRNSHDLTTCYMGIGFYKSLGKSNLHTSAVQIFNERGDGYILKGGTAKLTKNDKRPYLEEDDAFRLINNSLTAYSSEHKTLPARIVIHKTSKFVPEELSGFKAAIRQHNISTSDLLSLNRSYTRLFRYGKYPPLRGTFLSLDEKNHILYTRGSVDFFSTYPGIYPPRTLQLYCESTEQTPRFLANEILALTKMNWNNTQFDRFDPITVRAARRVGDILKYLGDNDHYEAYYRYYM
ncbi:MAG: hypothetical protein KME14_13895 [Tildeniella torsiva UHER 1998/13D]|nr:hypothetical protein [Tildeniella torsiva UHER 1998/13D]